VSLILYNSRAGVMERSINISISCLIEYKAKEEREGERREVLAKVTEMLA
jgi:hypothetical protein